MGAFEPWNDACVAPCVKAIALFLWMMLFDRGALEDERESMQEKRSLQVPWPMVCHFIVRVIDGPGDTAVVVAKRDCPD